MIEFEAMTKQNGETMKGESGKCGKKEEEKMKMKILKAMTKQNGESMKSENH